MHTTNTSSTKVPKDASKGSNKDIAILTQVLCKACLRISEDVATSTNQQRGKLWEQIRLEFINTFDDNPDRNSNRLMHWWLVIQARINKISSCSYGRTRT